MNIFEDTNPRELKELLGQIHRRTAALPDFQRDFVWDPTATQELIVSIANNYPAGSLLRIRNTQNLFACREFQGAPALNGAMPTFLVLDGQQRLTSLYQAFYGVGDHRFYINIGDLLDGRDFEECIFHLSTTHKRRKRLEDFDVQANELILPLSVLEGGAGGFSQWMIDTALKSHDGDTRQRLQELGAIQQQWIQAIDDYRFPVVTLTDATPADAVCTIFETLNRTGVKLGAFELLTARFWPQGVNLRACWQQAQADEPVLRDFQIDPYYILQVIALIARDKPSCTRGNVLKLSADDITTWWERVVSAVGRALRLLRDDCGVLVPKWLPYATLVIPLAAVLVHREGIKGPQSAADREKITRWYWCSVFAQQYDNAANYQAVIDLGELLTWLDGGDPPQTVASFSFDPTSLRDTTHRQRALYRGAMGLTLRGGPRDFYTGGLLTRDLIIEKQVDDHHIFPNDFLARREVPQRLRDCVLNRTLIDSKTNKRISNRAPSDYMTEIRDTLGDGGDAGKFETLLSSHLLPVGTDSPFWDDDFDAFLRRREQALWQEIKTVTGLTDAEAPVEEDRVAQSDGPVV